MASAPPFWKTKTLEEMSRAEWESLCDGCGRCCLHKLRDEDTDALAFTNVACRLLDQQTCRCRDYCNRRRRVPDCVALTPAEVRAIDWLPPSCAYRRTRGREGPSVVAPSGLRRPRDRSRGGDFRARPCGQRAGGRAA